ELGDYSTELSLEPTRALGRPARVPVAPPYARGSVDVATRGRQIDAFAELDIAMTSVAPSGHRPLPLVPLVEAGVRFGLGEDGQRDYWSPYGNCDLLDRTWQLAFTNGFRHDAHIEMCLAIASIGGASIMSHAVPRLTGVDDRPGTAAGDRADLLLVDGETPTSAVMDRGTDRTVIHDGRIVADGLVVLGA
ncbi:N-isopropylammelide isopropylaminohydrolase, partial [Streptomyces sp. MS2A]|nr:N-isopropylammelide isopropylaminohydrolase [Streptomyces sp. MS2A]